MKKTAMITGVVLVALVLAVAATAYAATSGSGNVDVTASSNAKLVLSLDTNNVDFGSVDPGTTYGAGTTDVNVTVQSNKAYDISKAITDPAGPTQMGLATTFTDKTAEAKGTNTYADDYSVNVPWTTTPGALSASVMYTAVQN